MVTMVRHSITIPKKASTLLHRRAKATNSTISKAIVDIILENDEMLDDLEDLRLSKIVDERHKTSTGRYLTHEEVLAKVAK